MKRRRVVLDTNVVVAALRSRQGASFRLLALLAEDQLFEAALSVPLLFEYEDALARHLPAGLYSQQQIDDFLDYICQVGYRQDIFFLWRPYLPDPKDDMILELAVAAECELIVTHNQRDFAGIERFGLRPETPKSFLRVLAESL